MKLQPGDYVSTEGMSEEQYHTVCKAFMDAGAGHGEYGEYRFRLHLFWGWSVETGGIYTCDKGIATHFRRELTIQQILGEPEQMNLQEAYKVMQANCGIEVGDTVRVLKSVEGSKMGWRNSWEPEMNAYIGCDFVVEEISDTGLRFKYDENYYGFPFFVLELVKKGKKLPDPLEISSDKHVVFCEGGEINLGIHHLDFDTLEKIYLTAKGVKDGD